MPRPGRALDQPCGWGPRRHESGGRSSGQAFPQPVEDLCVLVCRVARFALVLSVVCAVELEHRFRPGVTAVELLSLAWVIRARPGIAALGLGHLRFFEGRFFDARRWLTEAELHQEQHDPIGLLAVTTSLQVGVACSIGDLQGAVAALERCRAALRGGEEPIPAQAPYLVCAEAWAAMAGGNSLEAQRTLLEGAVGLSVMPMHAARLTYEAMRAGTPAHRIAPALGGLAERCESRLVTAQMRHATARADRDADGLMQVADELAEIGARLYASEAAAHGARAFVRAGRQDSARRAAPQRAAASCSPTGRAERCRGSKGLMGRR